MSEMYSSASGSYSSYLAQRQNDEIKKTIEKESNQQKFMYFFGTGATIYGINEVANKVDSVNASIRQMSSGIQRMSTGIQTSINQNTYAVAASSVLLANTFNAGFDKLNNTLDLGFAGVLNSVGSMRASMSAGFDKLQETIDTWGTEICEKLDAIHDIVNNPLLTASRELFRRAQLNAQKQFYEEALEDVKGAIEKNKTDFISWGLMGKIYLFGMSEFSNVVDVPKALEAFTNACKYITPDIDESDEAKNMAAEFYFYAGYANYILSNESRLENKTEDVKQYLEASVKANAKSFALADTMLEAVYNQARALVLLKQKNEALSILDGIIRIDGLYSIKALGDEDFKTVENDVIELITNLRDEYQEETEDLLQDFNNNYELIGGDYCEQIRELIEKCEELADTDSPYLDVRAAYEAFSYEYEIIKINEHPRDLFVYENGLSFWENGNNEYFKFDTPLDFSLTTPVWNKDSELKNANKLLQIGSIGGLLKKVHKNQLVLRVSSLDVLTENGGRVVYDNIKSYLQRNTNEKLFRPHASYAFVQESYGANGKFVVTDNAFMDEFIYSSSEKDGKKWINYEEAYEFDYHDYNQDSYEWELDENTLVILETKETEDHHKKPISLRVYQRGIVSKQYLKEWKEKYTKKEEKQEVVQQDEFKIQKEDEDSEYVTVRISWMSRYEQNWIVSVVEIRVREHNVGSAILIFHGDDVNIDNYMYSKTQTPLKNKKGDALLVTDVYKEINLKKTDFFRYKDWVPEDFLERPWGSKGYERIYTTKENFFKDMKTKTLCRCFSISEGLKLGLLIENKNIKLKARKKRVRLAIAIAAIIIVLGIIVF